MMTTSALPAPAHPASPFLSPPRTGRSAIRLAPLCLLAAALSLPAAARADDLASTAAMQAQLRAKAAQIEALQARARDCDRLAANDYGMRLHSIDDVLGRWKFIYDAAANRSEEHTSE